MSDLKSTLAEKVEVIDTGTESLKDDNSLGDTQDTGSNIIMLRNNNTDDNSIVPIFAITLNEAKERLSMLQTFVKEIMIPNVDYGIIPHCKKPTLFKSGAEKLTDVFGFSKQFEVTNRVEDWSQGLFHYEIKSILINKKTGLVEAEGFGCCNSKEKKFKSQDSYSIINTILKMAKKRALIDSVLSATRSSDIFTQDIENSDTNNKQNFTKTSNPNNYQVQKINKSQQTNLISIINQKRISIEEIKSIMKEKYNVNESKYLSSKQADDFIEFLKLYNLI